MHCIGLNVFACLLISRATEFSEILIFHGTHAAKTTKFKHSEYISILGKVAVAYRYGFKECNGTTATYERNPAAIAQRPTQIQTNSLTTFQRNIVNLNCPHANRSVHQSQPV